MAHRINPWLLFGLGAAGVMFIASRAKAQAAPGRISPGGDALPAASGGASSAYTPAALDASVPGVSFAPSPLDPSILKSTFTAVPAVTSSQVASANSFWSTLQPVAAIDSGYITFPSGSQVAASLMGGGNTAMDGNGNYYVMWGGQVYQLGLQDSSGNWPARVVSQ